MSWGTQYEHKGFISHVSVDQLWSKKEQAESLIDAYKDDIIALATTTPPADGFISEDGDPDNRELWADYAIRNLRRIFANISEEYSLLFKINQALDVKEAHPEAVYNQ